MAEKVEQWDIEIPVVKSSEKVPALGKIVHDEELNLVRHAQIQLVSYLNAGENTQEIERRIVIVKKGLGLV